jgi:uncharacterized membrane protein YeaQ/YmgE (transglycosylase-associated protein family)
LHIIVMVLIGWGVGMCAKLLLPGNSPEGFVPTTLIGVCGAILAAIVGRQFGWWHRGDFPGFLLSLAGAVLLLFVYRRLRAKASGVAGRVGQ